jgi:hypothetical protein
MDSSTSSDVYYIVANIGFPLKEKKTQAEAELKVLRETMVQASVGDTVNMDVDMPLSPSFKGSF